MVNPANRFHLWIYRARPDIMAIVHTHAPYASALSMIGQPLVAAHMDTMALYDDCAHLATWPGVPVGDEEGEIIAAALGNKRAALLAHHGLLATGRTIEEAAIIACTIERAARLQLLAGAAGKIQEVDPALARQAHDYRSYPKMLEASFSALARRIAKAQPEVLN
jgi:L-fuculose-phosphate aldolase